MKNIHPVLMYTNFYQNKPIPDDPLSQLGLFNFEEVILVLILLKNSLNPKKLESIENETFKTLISRLPKVKQKRLLLFLANPTIPYALTNGIVVSKIITDVIKLLKYNDPKIEITSVEFEENLLDVILAYNENHYTAKLEPQPDDHQVLWKLLLMQDISGIDIVTFSRTSVPRQLVFHKFLQLKMGDKFAEFEDNLREVTGVSNIHEFILILLKIYALATQNLNGLITIDKTDRAYKILIDSGLVVDAKMDECEKFDLPTLISHPFFRTSKGELYLIDSTDFELVVNKIFSYLLFSKGEIGRFLPKINNYNNYKSLIGYEFIEKYLMGNLFQSMQKAGCRIILSDDKHLPDVTIILNERDIFLIEIKDTSMHFNVSYLQDVQAFQDFIDKYFVTERKGVKQLLNNIEYLTTDKQSLFKLKADRKKINVYPLIVFTDQHLTKNGVNDYVACKAHDKMAELKPNFKDIKPLTMIHYDFFVENISLLQQMPSLLKKSIDSYHRSCRQKMSKYQKLRSTANYMDAMISFDRFIVDHNKLYRLDKMFILNQIDKIFNLHDSDGKGQ